MNDRTRLDSLAASSVAMMTAITSLIESHPNKAGLLKEFDRQREQMTAYLLNQVAPESYVDEVIEVFDQIRLAFGDTDPESAG